MNPFLSANADRHFKLFGAVVLTAAVLSGCTAQAAGNAKDPKPAAQAEQIKTVKVTGVTKQKKSATRWSKSRTWYPPSKWILSPSPEGMCSKF